LEIEIGDLRNLMIPFLYASITSLATITGGALALYSRLRLVEKRYQIAFAGGAMVSIALFDLIPEMQTHNAIALLVGFLGIYLLEKLVLFHACREEECETHTLGWTALIGIATESLIDGMAIAVGFRTSPTLGLLLALAVFLHEAPRGFATAAIMRQAGYKDVRTWLALLVDAGFAPLGVLIAGLIPSSGFEPLLGFTAGVFLYVGASDLLPEAHKRFNLRVIVATVAGAIMIPALTAWLG
jgi:zinc transporter ZupT